MKAHFQKLDKLPGGFFDITSKDIRKVFPVPTLIHLRGHNPHAVFISILLHGNEYSGLKIIQQFLSKHRHNLSHSIFIFIGNVHAAAVNRRVLAGQVDFNRCWPGTELEPSPTTDMMQQVFDSVNRGGLFAAIDLHNNSGTNPHYACITDVTPENQNLAAMFNRIAIVFKRPKGVSTMAFDGICPAVTLECGVPGDHNGIRNALEFFEHLFKLEHLSGDVPAPQALHLVQALATLNIPEHVSFDFDLDASADLNFEAGFERKNFTLVDSNAVFAHTRIARPLSVTNQLGDDVADEILRVMDGKVYLNKPLMPAMITLDKQIARQDCLCYLLQGYEP